MRRHRSLDRAATAGRRPIAGRPAKLGATLAVIAVMLSALVGCSAATSGSNNQAVPETTVPENITLEVAEASFGRYLTNGAGRAVYMWEADRHGTSTCYDECAVDWPPVSVGSHIQAGDGVDEDLVGAITRDDGTTQVTYGGWPLYYFAPDVDPGQLSGQGDTGFGAVWWVVSPDGSPLPSATQQ